jgi:hypothetical protein
MELLLEACANGDLMALKTIYNSSQFKINIREQNDVLFKTACRFNYPFIAKWLVSICSDYEILDIHKRHGITYGIKRIIPFSKNTLITGDCAICLLDDLNDCIKINCSHIFCKFCITEWSRSHETCPICRNKIEIN